MWSTIGTLANTYGPLSLCPESLSSTLEEALLVTTDVPLTASMTCTRPTIHHLAACVKFLMHDLSPSSPLPPPPPFPPTPSQYPSLAEQIWAPNTHRVPYSGGESLQQGQLAGELLVRTGHASPLLLVVFFSLCVCVVTYTVPFASFIFDDTKAVPMP